MEKQFWSHLQQLVPQPEEAKFLLAVSGGADSSVMAFLFAQHRLTFDIAHCNFHLREGDADKDMLFVKNMEKQYGKQVFIKEFFPADFERMKGHSTEMIARELRYHWFDEVVKGYDYLVTAHHADDNAETVLLNMARGTGLKGLTGIPVVNKKIIRPLLSFSSEEIRTFAKIHHIHYQEDYTNYTEQYSRNKIRLAVIPKLKEINPNLIHTFTHNTKILNQQYNFYKKHIDKIKTELLKQIDDTWRIDIDDLTALEDHELILYELLSPFGFNAESVENIAKTLHGISGKKFFSPSHLLIKDRTQLIISIHKETDNQAIEIIDIESLRTYGFEIEEIADFNEIRFPVSPDVLYVDAQQLSFPLTLRTWKSGDYFYPFGMRGKKKLSDFFNDLKIDIQTKQSIPLLCCSDDIVWIVGYRSDNRYRIENKPGHIYYKIKYHGILYS